MIDLHTHSIHSDGRNSACELLKLAEEAGLSMLSITDHNAIGAYFELMEKQPKGLFGGKIISGIEYTTTFNGEVIEVLGYGFDVLKMNKLMEGKILSYEEKQKREFRLICDQYKKIGVAFEESKVVFDPKKGSSRGAFWVEIIQYPENRKFFLDERSLTNPGIFSRQEVYNPKSPLFVDESSLFLSLNDTVEIIHKSGGKAFLAHLFVYSKTIPEHIEELLDSSELDGLECVYPSFSNEQRSFVKNLCQSRGLLLSGGSDFHGTNPNKKIGVCEGNFAVDEALVEGWINKLEPFAL